jgi:hypothetical protein
MVKASDPWQSDDSSTRGWSFLYRPPCWRVPQPRVDSLPVVVIDIFPEDSTEVILVDHDHVIQQLASHGSDPVVCQNSAEQNARGSKGLADTRRK